MIQEELAHIEMQLEKAKSELETIQYFIANALCKETKEIYQQTLIEKQSKLHLLAAQKEQLLNHLKHISEK